MGKIREVTKEIVSQAIPPRDPEGHKGTFGRVLMLCGSREMPGAARLAIRSAYRVGAGLVLAMAGASFVPYLKQDIPEVIVHTVPQTPSGCFSVTAFPIVKKEMEKANVVVFGPGTGRDPETGLLLRELIRDYPGTLIVDGDGLYHLAQNPGLLEEKKGRVLLTPHLQEFARLTGKEAEDIRVNREVLALEYATRYQCTLVLKGPGTLIAGEQGALYRNSSGSNALSKAGTGDVLAGLIAGLAAQGASPEEAAYSAVYLHGLAGDLAAREFTSYGVLAGDVVDFLPKALKMVLEHNE